MPFSVSIFRDFGFYFRLQNGLQKPIPLVLARSWRALAASWCALGVSWRHLGRLLGAFWSDLTVVLG